MARPTKYDITKAERILTALRAGNIEADAAAFADVPYGTYRHWKEDRAQFRAAVDVAKAQAKVAAVTTIRSAWGQSWKSAAWWLERRFPEEWGKRDILEVTIKQEAERIAAEHNEPVEKVLAELNERARKVLG
jgi:transposase